MLNYLLAPTFQFTNTAGRPLSGGAYLEVYIHGTRTKYYCASDFEGNLHPFQIPLDSLGSSVVLAEDTGTYDVYAYNRFGSLSMSRYNVKPGAGGSGMGSITSSDGSIEVTPTSTGVDLKVNGQDPSVIRATADDLDADGSFTFSALVIEGQDLSVDEHGRIRMEDGWYHYDATVKLVWEGSVNDSAAVQLYTTLNSDVMDFDLSYAHDETVQLGGETKITTGGTSFVLGVSGLPSGMSAQLVDLGIHTITGHGDAAGYEAGDGIIIDDHEISVDPTYVQEKLTAGDNITISDNVISATDTTYTAGTNVQISAENVISATDTTYTAGTGLDLNGTEFSVDTSEIQEKLTAGNNVQINGSTISATDTTYTAGTGLSLSGTEFSVDTSEIQEKLTAGSNIVIEGNTISATAEPQLQANWTENDSSSVQYIQHKPDLSVYATDAELTSGLATKQDTISDLATIRSGAALGASAVQPSDLATVATTGSYDDLTSKPDLSVYATDAELSAGLATKQDTLTAGQNITITNNVISADAAPQEQSDWTETDTSNVSYIKHKPSVKPVVAGANITITEGADSFVISAESDEQVQADWSESDSSDPSYIQNKPDLSVYATGTELSAGLATKQDTISDLAAIRSGAALGASSVQPSDLATVATTGDYDDLTDKPDLSVYATDSDLTAGLATKQDTLTAGSNITIQNNVISATAAPQEQADWAETDSSDVTYIKNKPQNLVQDADYVHTDNNFSDADVSKLAGIEAGAEANVQADWNETDTSSDAYIQNKPDLSVYATTSAMNTALATKQDTLTAGSNITITNNVISATAAPQEQSDWAESDSSDVSYIKNKPTVKPVVAGSNITITEGNDSITISATATQQVQADWAEVDTTAADYIKNKPTIPSGVQLVPAATSADADKVLTVDDQGIPGWAVIPEQPTGLFEAEYGTTTFADIAQAITDKRIVYCKVDQGGLQARMAFLAYASSVGAEFQYYRSLGSHSASTQTDEVYIYKATSTGWTTTTRKTGVNVTAGTHMSQSYSNDVLTLNCTWPTVDQSYNALSANAQSGVAVAEALASIDQGLFLAQYGTTTYAEVGAAVAENKAVYCYVNRRMAFLAYIGASYYEFQYYRSNNSSSDADSVFVYQVSSSGWTTTERTVKAGNIDYPVTQVNVNGSSAMTGTVANITIPVIGTVTL